MPQIAQQDYLYIKPESAKEGIVDAAVLGQLRRGVERGTIWDSLIVNFLPSGEGVINLSKVLAVIKEPSLITLIIVNPIAAEIIKCGLGYTSIQYEGLAAIQAGLKAGGSIITKLPALANSEGGLTEDFDGTYVSVDECYLIPTIDSARIVSLSIGDKIPDGTDFTNITWEDAQKLIGLPIQ